MGRQAIIPKLGGVATLAGEREQRGRVDGRTDGEKDTEKQRV